MENLYSLFARGECGEPAELNWDVGEGVDLEGLGERECPRRFASKEIRASDTIEKAGWVRTI